MRINIRTVALGVGLALAASACSDWLSDPKTDADPNVASAASTAQLFTAVQANANIALNGPGLRLAEMWAQRMSGTDRQYQSYGVYQGVTENSFDFFWLPIYTGGGIVDLQKVQVAAAASGDRIYSGIAKVFEAMLVGTAADLWGDVPYSGVLAGDATPTLDAQADVYTAVQTLLDGAIADLASGDGPGPGALDLSYGGDASKWIAAAHSLKARYYLHTAKANAAAYGQAATEAALGITNPANDLRLYSSTKAGEENIWFQFFRERDSYLRAGKVLVDIMKARNDPRLTAYFGAAGNGQIGGASPGDNLDGSVHSWLSNTRGGAAYRQAIVTADETSLILAEALARGGNSGGALNALNTERQRNGLGNVTGLTGNPLLLAILEEKYVATFQSFEGYNDYRRTCYPNLTPATGADQFGGNLPPRFYYPSVELTANPNLPAISAQPRRNALDMPAVSTTLEGAACKGQK